MPIQTVKADQADTGDQQQQLDAELFNEDKTLTTVGEVITSFLGEIDFTDFAADPDVVEFVTQQKAFIRERDDGTVEECQAGDDGAIEIVLETIPGIAVAELIDVDDLYGLWAHYVKNELPQESLADKVRLSQVLPYLEEEDLVEFKRGEFRKIRKAGAQGKNKVTRMLLAMIHKEAIKRVSKGSGYKKGDYAPGGKAGAWKFYPQGSKPGIAKVTKHTAANKGKLASLQAKSGTKKVMKAAVVAGSKGAKKAAVKAGLFGKGGKQKVVASTRGPNGPVLNESRLVGAAVSLRGRHSPQGVLTEAAASAK